MENPNGCLHVYLEIDTESQFVAPLMPQFIFLKLLNFLFLNFDCMCILPNIIIPKPIQYVKAKIIFSVFLLYLKLFPSL